MTTTTPHTDNRSSDKSNGGVISERIVERSLPLPSTFKGNSASKFKNSQTKRGFPSLDRPLGTFVPKSSTATSTSNIRTVIHDNNEPTSTRSVIVNDALDEQSSKNNATVVMGMSEEEHNEAIQEIQSVLSAKSIAFLKARGQKKKEQEKVKTTKDIGLTFLSHDDAEEDGIDIEFAGTKDFMMHYVESSDSSIELSDIASLLRSSLPRQRLAAAKRLVQFYLQPGQYSINSIIEVGGPLLPSTLRCNLDYLNMKKLSHKTSNILCTYCLQALYLISKLILESKGGKVCNTNPHELYFMNDSIIQPITSTKLLGSIDISSPTIETNVNCAVPAEDDGTSFYGDPAWVLLTRFKIIPCIATILSANRILRKQKNNILLSPECVSSIIGIISIVVSRSVTASTVISKHNLMHELVYYGLEHPIYNSDLESLFDPNGNSCKTLELMISLARQSRQTAESPIFHESIPLLQSILSLKFNEESRSCKAYCVRSRAIILWRTLLRYGLCISHLEAFSSLSSFSLSFSDPVPYLCVAEYLSAFTVVNDSLHSYINCKDKYSKDDDRQRRVSFAQTKDQDDNTDLGFSPEEKRLLSSSQIWFAPFVTSTIQYLIKLKSIGHTDADSIKLVSARIKFVSSFIRASTVIKKGATSNNVSDSKFDIFLDIDFCINALKTILSNDAFLKSLEMVVRSMFLLDGNYVSIRYENEVYDDNLVAAMCSLVESVSMFAVCIAKHHETTAFEFLYEVYTLILSYMEKSTGNFVFPNSFDEKEDIPTPYSLFWFNSSHFALLHFLQESTKYIKFNHTSSHFEKIQAGIIALIGRLQIGNEALVVSLLENDILSCIPDSIKAMLLREFTNRSNRAKIQLLHSLSLCKNIDVPFSGKPNTGSFWSQTLRYELECPPKERTEDPSPLLPLGKCWLFYLLSSTKMLESSPSTTDIDSIIALLTSTLSLIVKIEESKSLLSSTSQLHVGQKLYYLCNVLLHDEDIIRDDNIHRLFKILLEKYVNNFLYVTNDMVAKHFLLACQDHSNQSNLKPEDNIKNLLSQSSTSSLDDFFTDISTIFCEFGAQYEVFVFVMRSLLKIPFSSYHIAFLLKKLKDVLHLLTYESELTKPSKEDLANELYFTLWKCQTNVKFFNDSSDVLDVFTIVLQKPNAVIKVKPSFRNMGFIYLLAIGIFSKNIIALKTMSPTPIGMNEAMSRRLSELDKNELDKLDIIVKWFEQDGDINASNTQDMASTFCLKVIETCLV